MSRRRNGISAWVALASYTLVMLAVHVFHSHEHTSLSFVSAGPATCSAAGDESDCGDCSHDQHRECDHSHSHDGDRHHHHDEDGCVLCQYLAAKIVATPTVAVPVAAEAVSLAPPPAVIPPDAPGPTLPNTRAPPRTAC